MQDNSHLYDGTMPDPKPGSTDPDEDTPGDEATDTQSFPAVAPTRRTINDLTPDEYAELHLDIQRRGAEEAEVRERERNAREAPPELPSYDEGFTFMNLFSARRFIGALILSGFVGGIGYVLIMSTQGVNVIEPGTPMPSDAQAMYLFLLVCLMMVSLLNGLIIFMHYLRDRLKIIGGALVYEPPRIPWLLMFGGKRSRKQISLIQAGTGDFQQNPIESLFKLNSTSYVLDTDSVENRVFKKLRGVRNSEILEMYFGKLPQK